MSIGLGKTTNAYADFIEHINAPKTVFMAIAFSFAMRICDDNADAACELVSKEWELLYQNNIVPQKPRKS